MELILHAGLDKCGSTSIQVHLIKYRAWFLRQGVYIPLSGLTGVGHYPLFEDLSESRWAPLRKELAEAGKFARGVISYEGMHFLDPEQLRFVQQQMQDHDLKFLFYLREQSEIIQSGYLQKLKRRKQSHAMADFRHNTALLTPLSRDYPRMLDRFERGFPGAEINARVYDRSRLTGGDVVGDFLEFLGLRPDPQIPSSPRLYNTSLDVQAAELLNVYDSVSDDTEGREVLVDDLLLLIAKYGGGERRFLDDAAIGLIREHYRASNQVLLARYGVDLEANGPTADAAIADEQAINYVVELAKLARFPRWNGDGLSGPSLARLLQGAPGWSQSEARGTWSLGVLSRISFRVSRTRALGADSPDGVNFQGRYYADNRTTEVWANGALLGSFDLVDCLVPLPPDTLGDDRILELELRHCAPVSPAALGRSADERELAYCLEFMAFSRRGD